MSNMYKVVQINLEESLYDFIKKYIDSFIPNTDVSFFIKCLAINRLISLGVLNEVGSPNDFIFGPKLDFSSFDNSFDLQHAANTLIKES